MRAKNCKKKTWTQECRQPHCLMMHDCMHTYSWILLTSWNCGCLGSHCAPGSHGYRHKSNDCLWQHILQLQACSLRATNSENFLGPGHCRDFHLLICLPGMVCICTVYVCIVQWKLFASTLLCIGRPFTDQLLLDTELAVRGRSPSWVWMEQTRVMSRTIQAYRHIKISRFWGNVWFWERTNERTKKRRKMLKNSKEKIARCYRVVTSWLRVLLLVVRGCNFVICCKWLWIEVAREKARTTYPKGNNCRETLLGLWVLLADLAEFSNEDEKAPCASCSAVAGILAGCATARSARWLQVIGQGAGVSRFANSPWDIPRDACGFMAKRPIAIWRAFAA